MKNYRDEFFVFGCIVGIAFFLDLAANPGDPFEVLWFCPATALLLSIGLFRKSATMMTMVLLMSIPTQFFWIIDFVLQHFGMGRGRTEMLFLSGPFVYGTSLLLHALLIPVSAYGVWKLGFSPRAFLPSILYGWALLMATYLFTDPALNHNCAFFPCDAENPGFGYDVYLLRSLLMWTSIFIVEFFVVFLIIHRSSIFKKRPYG